MTTYRIIYFIVSVLPFLSPLSLRGETIPEKPMVVIIASYNNIQWYERNLSSVFSQDYTNYRVIYVDDVSKDGTADAVEKYVKEKNQGHRFQLCRNDDRVGAMANLYGAIHTCSNKEIAVLLDGDDWLSRNDVLKQLNTVYSSGEVWYTHGRMIEYPNGSTAWCEPITPTMIANKSYREGKPATHLRTFYVWLFKKIRLQDFLYKGEFLKMAWDMAIMFPIEEMAEERHAFINEVNYVYNIANPINDNKVDAQLQNDLDKLIRGRRHYQRLERAEVTD